MNKNDGQPRLRASIASELAKDGWSQQQAEAEASKKLNSLRNKPAGMYEVCVGNTVIIVTKSES
jgi:hypothetical protein